MNERLTALQTQQLEETERLKLECDKLKEAFTHRLQTDYLPIAEHEKLINEELAKAAQQYQEQLKTALQQ